MIQKISKKQAIDLIDWHPVGLIDTVRNGTKGPFYSVFEDVWIYEKLDKFSDSIQISGPDARAAGYGICLCDELGYLFITTDPQKLSKLNIIDTNVTGNN